MTEENKLSREELIERLEAETKARRALEERRDDVAEHRRLAHELQVHQVELEAQNQALRETQGQLEESRSRYVDLYDFAPIAYLTFDRDGVVLEINLTGASMLGRDRSWIIGKPFLAVVRLDDPGAFVRHLRSALGAVIPIVSESSLSTERGPMEVQLVSTAVRNLQGAPTSCRTALLDITQRRSAERAAAAAHASEKALRGRIEAIDRASAAVSAAVANVSGPEIGDFFEVIVRHARELTRAEFAALGIGGAEGKPFDPWVSSGVDLTQAAAMGRTPRGVGLLGIVVASGQPVRLRDLGQHGSFSGFPSGHPQMTSFLAVPIRYHGQIRGNLYLANKHGADEFSEEDQTVIEMLADRVGIAMEVTRLRQVEAREHIRLELLARAGPLLAESIDYDTTLNAIARLVVPVAADLSAIDLVQEGGAVRKFVVYHPDPSKQKVLDLLLGTTPPERLPDVVRAAIETAQPQRRDVTHEFLRHGISDPVYRDVLQEVGATSTILVPLILRGRVVGLLRLAMAESGRRYTDDDLLLAQEIAHHAALAIEAARLYRVAQTAIRARDNLLAVVSHDLRNYLTTIRLSAQILGEQRASGPFTSILATGSSGSFPVAPAGTSSPPAVERRAGSRQIEAIQRASTRMEQLIGSLRDATMIETGHFTIVPRTEGVAALVDEAVKTLEPQVEGRSLHLKVALEDQLPAVHCDRERVLQVIANLVGNAIKFTRAGGEICIGARPASDGVCISVSDTGAGIAPDDVSHVFDHYWKGHRDQPEGTGLGLFIAKGIVEAHRGTIWVESQVGVGTTFAFTLPVAPSGQTSARPRGETEDTSNASPSTAGT